jgi:hypothetical protein
LISPSEPCRPPTPRRADRRAPTGTPPMKWFTLYTEIINDLKVMKSLAKQEGR